MIQGGGEIFLAEIHKLINFIWINEELPDQWKEAFIVSAHKKGDKRGCNYRCILMLSTSDKNFIEYPLKVKSIRDQILIRYFAPFRYWRKDRSTIRQYISYSQTSRKLRFGEEASIV
jgi:hypothetical protein